MNIADWVMVLAILSGPILAVQAQKWIEWGRARSHEKEAIFRTLMSTRATRLSEEHVRALNMIDVVYLGGKPSKRSKAETAVFQRWCEYRGHLFQDQQGFNEFQKEGWFNGANSLFAGMLEAMASERGYEFDKHALGALGYSPLAHGYIQTQQELMRALMVDVLSGRSPLSMAIKEIPADPEWNESVLKSLQEIEANTGKDTS